MPGFKNQLHTVKVGKSSWRLVSDLIYVDNLGNVHRARKGLVTDITSVPYLLRGFMPRASGNHVEPAVLHDAALAYRSGPSRSAADKLFLEAMRLNGVPFLRRWAAYGCVRLYALIRREW